MVIYFQTSSISTTKNNTMRKLLLLLLIVPVFGFDSKPTVDYVQADWLRFTRLMET